MPHSIEENLFSLNVITDTVVTYTDTPLTNSDICESCSLPGIFLETRKCLKHTAMHRASSLRRS